MQTSDQSFAKRNKLKNLSNLEILTTEDGKSISQIDTTPRNMRLFENAIIEWENRARTIGAANEAIMGEPPTAGTPFKLQELVTAESHSLHEYRKGKLAKFWEKIYRKWIIPKIVDEINQGQEFLAELDLDEMQSMADKIAKNQAEKMLKEKVLNGQSIAEGERDELKERIKASFMEGGNKKFIELLKDELKDAPVDIEINIVGKQKNLAGITDKLVNVLRFMLQTYDPQTKTFAVFEDPRMLKTFENIIEYSGLSPMDFYAPANKKPVLQQPMAQPTQIPANAVQPLQALAK
jgi:hypothetical protein